MMLFRFLELKRALVEEAIAARFKKISENSLIEPQVSIVWLRARIYHYRSFNG